ncbi:MAG: leucine-rich repeat protein [Muribaculaceae bacterium]|nr:leucine-rich repeat protein [Muribaculaceae bacterium]
MKQKLLFLLVTLAFLLPARLSAFTYKYEGSSLTYLVIDEEAKTCLVKGYNSTKRDLIIPEVAKDGKNEYKVTEIGELAFLENSYIRSVKIPNSITDIRKAAFADCLALDSVEIPNSVKKISESTFSRCTSLSSIVIPNSITTIEKLAFSSCKKLASVEIPNSVTSIGELAFYECSGLTSVEIPNSVKSIGRSAFQRCSKLTSLAIPTSITTIENETFAECSSLTSVVINDSITSIGTRAFSGCYWLTSVVIGASVKKIGSDIFENCEHLRKLVIPNHLSDPYQGNKEAKSLIQYDTNDYTMESGCLYNKEKSILHFVPIYLSGEFQVPESVKEIGYSAFSQCRGLSRVQISNSVSSIGTYAFWDCDGLQSVVIPNSVTTVKAYSFMNCTNLRSIGFPNSVIQLGTGVFKNCENLRSVTIGNSVTNLGKNIFENCNELIKVAYPNNLTLELPPQEATDPDKILEFAYDPNECIYEDEFIYGPEKKEILFAPSEIQGTYIVPETVITIGDRAFSRCENLKSVEIGRSLGTIKKHAFSRCKNLMSLKIYSEIPPNMHDDSFNDLYDKITIFVPDIAVAAYVSTNWNLFTCIRTHENNLYVRAYSEDDIDYFLNPIDNTAIVMGAESDDIYIPERLTIMDESDLDKPIRYSIIGIGYKAFENKQIKSLNIHTKCNLKIIGDYAFKGSAISSIDNLASVETIGKYAFAECQQLSEVTFKEGLKEINSHAFYNCDNLLSVSLPASLAAIGEYAFAECSILSEATLADGLREINSHAFYRCRNLLTITLPASLATIGENSFGYCTKLASVSIPDATTTIGNRAFESCSSLKEVTLPEGLKKLGSKSFANSGLTSIFVPGSVKEIESEAFYECSNLSSATLSEGLEILGSRSFSYCGLKTVSIPSSLKVIEERAFYACKSLSLVNFEEGLNLIKADAFSYTAIDSINIPSSVKEISDRAFSSTELTKIELHEGLEIIGTHAFCGDGKNDSLYIPSTVKTIYDKAFELYKPSKINISDLAAWCRIDFFSISSNPLSLCGKLYLNGEELTTLNIPEEIEVIKPYTFYGFTSLQEVNFPSGLNTIGSASFCGSINLTSLSLPDSIETIGDSAFSGCDNLSSISFGNGLKTIMKHAFSGCNKLSSISLCDGLKTIENYSFYKCENLNDVRIPAKVEKIGYYSFAANSVVFEGGVSPISIEKDAFYKGLTRLSWGRPLKSLTFEVKNIEELTIGGVVEEIPEGRFRNLPNLRKLNLCNTLHTIEPYAFSGCTELVEVVVPPAVETIGASAFAGNSKLESIIMGHSVKTIGDKAFDGCPANTVCITAQTPPTTPNNAFSNYMGNLYLQGQAAMDAYYDAYSCWDRFSSNVMVEPTGMKLDGDKTISGKPRDTFQLKATLMPDDVTLPQIFWSSTNPEVATVDHEGLVTLHTEVGDDGLTKKGCKIIAESLYSNGPIAELIVSEGGTILVSDIHLSKEELKMIVGNSTILSASIEPEDATNSNVIWTSSDNAIVTVNDKGEVLAVGVGDAVIKVTAADGSGIEASCIVHVLALGDSNGNGELNIADAVNTANYAVGNDVTNFVFETADVNTDGEITLSDASGTITILLSQTTTIDEYRRAPKPIAADADERDVLVLGSFDTEDSKLDVRLRASTDYVALQADIVLPEECTLNSITTGPCAIGHSLMMKQLGENVYRVVLFDLGNRHFNVDDEALFTLHLESASQNTEDIVLGHIVAADKAGNEYRLGSFADLGPSSVEAAEIYESFVTVTDGRIAVAGESGTYVTVYSIGGNVVDRFMIDGETHYCDVETGIYIVSIGDKSTKVIVK